MLERIVENWLDRANERSFQIPFCHVLSNKGHTIIHVSRHCGMEMGKDIISLNENGTPCAFQLKSLKGKKMTLSMWREDLGKQINALALGKIIHPAIKDKSPHLPFIVINGTIDEEVSREIDDFNRSLIDTGRQENIINVIVKGQLQKDFINLQESFWPGELSNTKEFLELFLEDGQNMLPKDKLASILFNSLPMNKENIYKSETLKAFASAAVICSSSISEFTNSDNHFAEFEGWVLYISYILALAEKNGLDFADFENEYSIAVSSIYNSLSRLCDELIERKSLIDGNDGMAGIFLNKIRTTILVGVISLYGLWRKTTEEKADEHDEFIKDFVTKNSRKMDLWGEYAIPQFLASYFYKFRTNPHIGNDFLLLNILSIILARTDERKAGYLASPYYNSDTIIPFMLNIEKKDLKDTFKKSSYTLEAILHLCVRTNLKQHLILEWPQITKNVFRSFEPNEKWENYLWRSEKGTNKTFMPPYTKHWDDLVSEAREKDGSSLPEFLKISPILYLAFLIVYPHRLTSNGIRWLDSTLRNLNFNY